MGGDLAATHPAESLMAPAQSACENNEANNSDSEGPVGPRSHSSSSSGAAQDENGDDFLEEVPSPAATEPSLSLLLLSSLVSQALCAGTFKLSVERPARSPPVSTRGSGRTFAAEIDRARLLAHVAQPVPCVDVAMCVPRDDVRARSRARELCVVLEILIIGFLWFPRDIAQAK